MTHTPRPKAPYLHTLQSSTTANAVMQCMASSRHWSMNRLYKSMRVSVRKSVDTSHPREATRATAPACTGTPARCRVTQHTWLMSLMRQLRKLAVSIPESAFRLDRQRGTLACPYHDAEALLWPGVCRWSCPAATPGACAHRRRVRPRRKQHAEKPQPGTVGVGTDTLPPLFLARTSQR
jgi:hypothetical protein